jgi:hypothetical protein
MSNTMRWTEEQLADFQKRQVSPVKPAVLAHETLKNAPARSKYGSTRVIVDGKRFDSKLEARYYDLLKIEWYAGKVLWFVRQVPFELPGGIRYRLDFLVVRPSVRIEGNLSVMSKDLVAIELIDCKGVLTPVSKNKIRQAEAIYGVKVKIVKSKDVRITS